MEMENPGPKLTLDEIIAFEREIDGELPDDYKRFLLANNGGYPVPEVGRRCKGEQPTSVVFYSLEPTGGGLRASLDELLKLNTEGFLPIAAEGEYEVCLECRKDNECVFLGEFTWAHEAPIGVKLSPLGITFAEFLDSLVPIPTIFCPVENLGRDGTPDDLADYLADGGSINALSKEDFTIVCEAIKWNNMPMFLACIDNGANLSSTLLCAVRSCRLEMVMPLIAAGAEVNERDEDGETPLSYVSGTAELSEEGARSREMQDLLIGLGAVE